MFAKKSSNYICYDVVKQYLLLFMMKKYQIIYNALFINISKHSSFFLEIKLKSLMFMNVREVKTITTIKMFTSERLSLF